MKKRPKAFLNKREKSLKDAIIALEFAYKTQYDYLMADTYNMGYYISLANDCLNRALKENRKKKDLKI